MHKSINAELATNGFEHELYGIMKREQLLTEALQSLLSMDVNGHTLEDRLQFSGKGRALLEQARAALGAAL